MVISLTNEERREAKKKMQSDLGLNDLWPVPEWLEEMMGRLLDEGWRKEDE